MQQVEVPVCNHKQADEEQHKGENLQPSFRVAVQTDEDVRDAIRKEGKEFLYSSAGPVPSN